MRANFREQLLKYVINYHAGSGSTGLSRAIARTTARLPIGILCARLILVARALDRYGLATARQAAL